MQLTKGFKPPLQVLFLKLLMSSNIPEIPPQNFAELSLSLSCYWFESRISNLNKNWLQEKCFSWEFWNIKSEICQEEVYNVILYK